MAELRICFLGDSVSVGTGDAACRGWPSYLCAEETTQRGHDVSCYNLGIRAETSMDIAKRWQAESTPRLPSHVPGRLVFMFGLNDSADFNGTGVRVPHDASVVAGKAMIAAAKQWLPALWIGLTPVRRIPPVIEPGADICYTFDRDRGAALNKAYAAAAAEIGVPYIDMFARLEGNAEWEADMDSGDGVHPSDAGHQLMARVIADASEWRAWFKTGST